MPSDVIYPLSMVAPGESVRLIQVHGGQNVRRRLAELGLTPGVMLRVVQGEAFGPMIVAFKDDARLALGRGMAHKIEVEAL